MLCGGDFKRDVKRTNSLNGPGGIGDLCTGCWLVRNPIIKGFFHPVNPTNMKGTDQ
jgi:hypothetical protein